MSRVLLFLVLSLLPVLFSAAIPSAMFGCLEVERLNVEDERPSGLHSVETKFEI